MGTKSPYSQYAPSTERRRPTRVADLIKVEVSGLLLRKLNDPRLTSRSRTITQVEVTADLRNATIFYSMLGDKSAAKEVEAGLSSAKGFMRSHLARVLDMKYVPDLRFKRDLTMVWQDEMEKLLSGLDDTK